MPLLYSIARRIGARVYGAIFTCVLFLFDNLNLIESRLILVDSQLMFYSCLALWVALMYLQRRRDEEDAELTAGCDLTSHEVEPEEAEGVISDDDAATAVSGYGTLGSRAVHSFDSPQAGTEAVIAHAVVQQAASQSDKTAPLPRRMSWTERILWAAALGLACGAAVSIKWTALATPGMIAMECFFAIFFLRRAVPIFDILIMGFFAFVFYAANFWIHFQLLPYTGDGDGFMRVRSASSSSCFVLSGSRVLFFPLFRSPLYHTIPLCSWSSNGPSSTIPTTTPTRLRNPSS